MKVEVHLLRYSGVDFESCLHQKGVIIAKKSV